MFGLLIEFTLVVAAFLWLWRVQVRDRHRAQRVPPSQLGFRFSEDDPEREL